MDERVIFEIEEAWDPNKNSGVNWNQQDYKATGSLFPTEFYSYLTSPDRAVFN